MGVCHRIVLYMPILSGSPGDWNQAALRRGLPRSALAFGVARPSRERLVSAFLRVGPPPRLAGAAKLLGLLVALAGYGCGPVVRMSVELCWLSWRAALSHTTRGAEQLRRGCGATRRVMFDTSPLAGWRMRSCAPVCERLGCQPLAQVPISYAIFLPRAVLRHFRTADSA